MALLNWACLDNHHETILSTQRQPAPTKRQIPSLHCNVSELQRAVLLVGHQQELIVERVHTVRHCTSANGHHVLNRQPDLAGLGDKLLLVFSTFVRDRDHHRTILVPVDHITHDPGLPLRPSHTARLIGPLRGPQQIGMLPENIVDLLELTIQLRLVDRAQQRHLFLGSAAHSPSTTPEYGAGKARRLDQRCAPANPRQGQRRR
mmetsp:Transcript_45538/g.120298  ORF Transcript_45538/g.120298 Transcript_45538/m.120298 type:complete len:204 (-) Transcript_45538:75-686(-)